jgi:hypothetical protein
MYAFSIQYFPRQELGYYQKKKLEEHKQRVAEQQKREQRTLEKLVRQKEQVSNVHTHSVYPFLHTSTLPPS